MSLFKFILQNYGFLLEGQNKFSFLFGGLNKI